MKNQRAGGFCKWTGTIALISTLALGAAALASQSVTYTAWQDDFTGTQVDTTRWVIANGQAPGYIANDHIGYYDPTHVSVANGYLTLLLTQQNGQVGTNPNGVISRGALVYTSQTYGYGTYEWKMRMSSTAASPTVPGVPVSGSVSAGFNYVNNSQTEIDFESPGNLPDTIFFVNWLNRHPRQNPTSSEETSSYLQNFDVTSFFRDYKFVWQSGQISYYVDGNLVAVHTTNVPTAPANFMINHWGTDNPNWGGTATEIGTPRYFYVDYVSYTPQ